ncbi:MAG: hypothetical protein LKG21_00005, partial [Ruminococcus sp.]|nr:hypothetical protein [Ruminococcus sp.]
MKKFLLNRAIAATVAVPLALTQCLAPAFAAAPEKTASKVITLSDITYIAPQDDDQHSDWNTLLSNALVSVGSANYDVDVTEFENAVAAKAGNYKEAATQIFAQLKDTKVKYDTINSTATLTGTLNEVGYILGDTI